MQEIALSSFSVTMLCFTTHFSWLEEDKASSYQLGEGWPFDSPSSINTSCPTPGPLALCAQLSAASVYPHPATLFPKYGSFVTYNAV